MDLSNKVHLEISLDFPSQLSLGSSCEMSTSTNFGYMVCEFPSARQIILLNPYPNGYTCCYEEDFRIIGIINPSGVYAYEEIKFRVSVMEENWIVFGREGMSLESRDGSRSYSAHSFRGGEVMGENGSTVAETEYTFSFINKDYPIFSNCSLRISLPPNMTFTATPTFTGLEISPDANISNLTTDEEGNPVAVSINRAFLSQPPNTSITFLLGNILNTYHISYDNIFGVSIHLHSEIPYFQDVGEFRVDVGSISPFQHFQLIPTSTMTSAVAVYDVEFTLGHGNLSPRSLITLRVPDDIQYCDVNSFELREACSLNIGDGEDIKDIMDTALEELEYGFKHPSECTTYNMSTVKFSLRCRNPVSTKRTENFILRAYNIFETATLFYESEGNPITMTTLSPLANIQCTMANNWINKPNNFYFIIQRTSSIISSQINIIKLTLSPSLTIQSCPSVTSINGTIPYVFCPLELQVNIVLISYPKNIEFTLISVINPLDPDQPINFGIWVGDNSRNYGSEEGITQDMFATCIYPCATCSNNRSNCSSCYSENNTVFGGGANFHRLYMRISIYGRSTGQCLENCPHQTFYNNISKECVDCNSIQPCHSCTSPSNYTKCYPQTYLHLSQCLSNCPNGYSENKSNWTCRQVLTFNSPSEVIIVGDIEVEKSANYTFTLFPEDGLKDGDIIQITIPPDMGLLCTACYTSQAACFVAISGDIVILENLQAYYSVYFTITYVNPNLSYDFSSICFLVESKERDIRNIRHSGNICLGERINGESKYIAHILENRSVSLADPTTVTNSKLTFTLSSINFGILPDLVIALKFPSTFTFLSPQIIGGNLSLLASIANTNFPYLKILDGIPDSLQPNWTISFEISGILSPYQMGITEEFRISIEDGNNLSQYIVESCCPIIITEVAQFSSLTIEPSNYTTCKLAIYTFSLVLGDGKLHNNTRISIKPPPSVTGCNYNSITIREGINIPITNKFMEFDTYSFYCPEDVPSNTLIRFTMDCYNPETLRPTSDFVLDCSQNGEFYHSTLGNITMIYTNNFQSLVIEQGDMRPLVITTFRLTITRTANYTSTDIKKIIIIFNPEINIFEDSSIEIISGINNLESVYIQFDIDKNKLKIGAISSLSQQIIINILKIQNPPNSTNDIRFSIEAKGSEAGYTNILQTPCDFPCSVCKSGFPRTCTGCFVKNDEVFGIKMDEEYIYDPFSWLCVSGCPSTAYLDIPTSICKECESFCYECEKSGTNCTKCNRDSYLLDNECLTNCPSGYSNNKNDWRCHLILGFMEGSSIRIVDGEYEIDKLSNYSFSLQPQGDLPKEAIIHIRARVRVHVPELDHSLRVASQCEVSHRQGSCIVVEEVIRVSNCVEDYIISVSNSIQFILVDTYYNPPLNYDFNSISFLLTTVYMGTIYHEGYIPLTNTGSYLPHFIGSPSLLIQTPTTATYTQITFTLTNTQFPIPPNYNIIIQFPHAFGFDNPNNYTCLSNLHRSSMCVLEYPLILIRGGFPEGLGADMVISFRISNILTPYIVGRTPPVELWICKEYCVFSTHSNGPQGYVNNIAEFNLFTLAPSSYITSAPSIYTYAVKLGDGPLRQGNLISFLISPAVTNCDLNSILQIEGFTVPFTSTGSNSTTYVFWLKLSASVPPQTLIKFSIHCYNPETNRPLFNFEINAYQNIHREDIFYSSIIAQPIVMKEMNNFTNIEITLADYRPLVNNTFTFTITKTAYYPSFDINIIRIGFPSMMNVSSCSISTISGIIPETTELFVKDWRSVDIKGIKELDHTFKLEISNIQNPPLSLTDIKIKIITSSEDHYGSEKEYSDEFHVFCDFPCQTCIEGSPTVCLSCFPHNDPVFGSLPLVEMPSFLSASFCLAQCPPHHYQNIEDWICERRIYIYIYIYSLFLQLRKLQINN